MEIIPRKTWGARTPAGAPHKIATYQPRLILHHAAGSVVPGDDRVSPADLQRLKAIQNFHIDGRGWRDIAYNFLVDPDGNVFEGRGVGVANGATKGYGAISYAVCVLGNFDIQTPDTDLLDGLAGLVAYGHDQGWWPDHFTGGHRNYGSTSCPGSKLYPHIAHINDLAKENDMAILTPDEERKLQKFLRELEQINSDVSFVRTLVPDIRKDLITRDELNAALKNLPAGASVEATIEVIRKRLEP